MIKEKLNLVANSRRLELLMIGGMCYYLCTQKDKQMHADLKEMQDLLRQQSDNW